MGKYSDDDQKKTSISEPHPDVAENVAYFNKQMGRVRWLPSERECPVRVQVHDTMTESIFNPQLGKTESICKIKEYMHVLFIFPKGNETAVFNITFHQSSRKSDKWPGFKEELSAALNYLGGRGWLESTVKTNDGKWRDPSRNPVAPGARDKDDKWGRLFGKDGDIKDFTPYPGG